MSDNTRGGSTDGASPLIATDEVTYSGDTADVQLVRVVGVSGAEGSKTVDDIDTTVGLKVTDGSADYDDGSADGNPDTQIGATVHAYPRVFNGTTWDRMRGDTEGLFVKLRDESGSPLVTGVQYIEDSAITADLGQGTLVVGRRDNALSTLTPAEGDAVGLRVGATGALWTQPEGTVAHDTADSGNPVKIGGKAATTPPAAVANGDRVDAWFNEYGQLVVKPVGGDTYLVGGISGENVEVTGTGAAAALNVGGNIAHDVADSGNPIKIGGKAESTAPAAVADGDRVDAWFDTFGAQVIALQDIGSGGIGGPYFATSTSDALTASQYDGLVTASFGRVFNGTTWDRLRGDTGGVFVNGQVAHDVADTGNPIKIGGVASTASPAQVTADGDRVNASFTRFGAQRVHLVAADGTGLDTGSGVLIEAAAAGLVVTGDVVHDGVDAGKPLKIGGKAGTSINPTAVATSDRVDAHFDTKGRLGVFIASSYDGTGAVTGNTPADGFTATAGLNTQSMGSVFNGTTWDRARSGGATGFMGVTGAAAHASPTSGNPVFIAGRASTAIPTDVGADGDAAGMWTNRSGAQVVTTAPHIGLNSDPWNLVHEGAQYTSAQTSTVLVAGGASEKIVVTKVQIQAYATTAGTAILYFGTGAYSRGTNRAVFDGEFAPSSTLKPGVVLDGPFIAGTNGDDLMVTTTNALSITFNVWYYVVT